MLSQNKLIKKLNQLKVNKVDAFIIPSYWINLKYSRFFILKFKVGCKDYLKFLSDYANLTLFTSHLKSALPRLKQPTFHTQATKILALAKTCKQLGVDPTTNLTQLVQELKPLPTVTFQELEDRFKEGGLRCPNTKSE